MWFAIFAIAFVVGMALLTPKVNVENARAAKLGDFQFPRAGYGDAAPLVWGTVKLKSPVVIWFGDFTAVPIVETVDGGWFHSDKHYTVGYKNYLGIDCLLCIGPGVKLRKMWAGTDLVWSGNLSTVSNVSINLPDLFGGEKQGGGLQGTFTFYPGDIDSPQDSYLVSKIGASVPKYNGFARVLFKNFYIGTSTTPKAFSFEVQNFPTSFPALAGRVIGDDLNPMLIAWDAITQGNGKFGIDETALDSASFIAAGNTLYSEGLGMSLAVQSTVSGKDILEEIMRHADGVMYKDPATAKIKVKLIRNDYVVSNLQTVDESDIVEMSDFSKTLWADTFNQVRVTFNDRSAGYEDSVAIAQDFANITYQNRVRSSDISMPGAMTGTVANILAAKQLSILSVPLYKCTIICKRTVQNLRPGDVFKMSFAPYGISAMVMRISKIDFGTLEDGKIRITCIQDKFAVDTVIFGNPETSGWTPVTTSAQPVSFSKVIAAPYFLAKGDSDTTSVFVGKGRFLAVAERASGASISFDVRSSNDNFSLNNEREVAENPYFASGTLLGDISQTAGFETGIIGSGEAIVVANMSSDDVSKLHAYSAYSQGADGSGLMLINNEFFVYVGFTDNADGTVTLNNVYRALLDTTFGTHLAGDRVWFIEGREGTLPTLYPDGTTRNFRFLDNTVRDTLAIGLASNVSATQAGRAGKPLHPQYLTLQGTRPRVPATGATLTSVAAAWRRRNRDAPTIAAFNAADAPESGVVARVGWRVGAGAWTYADIDGASTTIPVTGLTGTLEVRVWGKISASGIESQSYDSLTMTLA